MNRELNKMSVSEKISYIGRFAKCFRFLKPGAQKDIRQMIDRNEELRLRFSSIIN